jgi:EpsI family protein
MRARFHSFPRQIGEWRGSEVPGDPETLDALNATDYLSMNFVRGEKVLVNVWSAYYQSQFSGNAAHSPLVCIPGGGWQIEREDIADIRINYGTHAATIPVNRLIIAQGDRRQLVYYWFIEGGMVETNEYLAKARLFSNAVLYNRRDGALVRLIIPIDGGNAKAAEVILQRFMSEMVPVLPEFLPAEL